MRRHASTVLKTVGQVVTGCIHVKVLVPFLVNMGKRHGKYGVEVEYFKGMGDALLWTLEKALGHRWTLELQAAWRRTYNILKEVMIMALKQEKDQADEVRFPLQYAIEKTPLCQWIMPYIPVSTKVNKCLSLMPFQREKQLYEPSPQSHDDFAG